MLAQRQIARAAQRYTAQFRAQAQRRFASTQENEFIRERRHVKEHAGATTGKDILKPASACSFSINWLLEG
jgi:cytochrome c oxidase subunit 6a